MLTFEASADVPDDRKVTLNLPEGSPTGPVRLIVTVESPADHHREAPRSSLAEWAEQNAEDCLRGDLMDGVTDIEQGRSSDAAEVFARLRKRAAELNE